MDTDEAKRFGELIRERRHELGLSTYALGELVGTRNSTIMRIEQGAFAAPRPDKLARIAQALHLSLADVFARVGYLVPDDLPSFHEYLPIRYRDLPDAAVVELRELFDELIARHGPGAPELVPVAAKSAEDNELVAPTTPTTVQGDTST